MVEDSGQHSVEVMGAVTSVGPGVALYWDDDEMVMSLEDARRLGNTLLLEAARAEGYALMIVGMRAAKLSHKTVLKALKGAYGPSGLPRDPLGTRRSREGGGGALHE